jgi:predicted protein tyrosine phosphatase
MSGRVDAKMNGPDVRAHPIADSYWVAAGLLLAGEYPGARVEAEARIKLGTLLAAGVRQFIDLTEAGEYNLRPYWPLVQRLAAERNLEVVHSRLSIPDMGTPARSHMLGILDAIDAAIVAGRPVYVHCFGGIGRTGTVVGCYLVRHGADAETALAEIARRRQGTPDGHRHSPETDEQRQFVLTWRETA